MENHTSTFKRIPMPTCKVYSKIFTINGSYYFIYCHKKPGNIPAQETSLHKLAFDKSLRTNIISTGSSGTIIIPGKTACKIPGYYTKELLIKAVIFDINESNLGRC